MVTKNWYEKMVKSENSGYNLPEDYNNFSYSGFKPYEDNENKCKVIQTFNVPDN